MRDNFELSTVDKLFLELSQFTTATADKEIKGGGLWINVQ